MQKPTFNKLTNINIVKLREGGALGVVDWQATPALSQLFTFVHHIKTKFRSTVLTLMVIGCVSLGVIDSVADAGSARTTNVLICETVKPLAIEIFGNPLFLEFDDLDDTADALRPINLSNSRVIGTSNLCEFDSNYSATDSVSLSGERIAQSGGVLDSLSQFLDPLLHPTTDGLPIDLTGIDLSWSGSGDDRIGVASSSLPHFSRSTSTNIFVVTVEGVSKPGFSLS